LLGHIISQKGIRIDPKKVEVRHQLAAVGEKILETELVNMNLNGFPTSWGPFLKGIYVQENIPD